MLDGQPISEEAIRGHELSRARHALAYLKARLGNDAMRRLLASDLSTTADQVRDWVARSDGRWQTATIELVVPGLSAQAFHDWYEAAMAGKRETVLRAGHPEHFVLSPGDDGVEVLENVGETALPWRVFYRSLPEADFPVAWDDAYPVRFGAEIVDTDGLRVGYTMHQSRNCAEGMRLLLRTLLPEAAPRSLVERHLRHFTIEFSNWTRVARQESHAKQDNTA